LTEAAMMNDVGDADDDASHQNVRNRCGSNKMRDDDDVVSSSVMLQVLLIKIRILNFKMNFKMNESQMMLLMILLLLLLW
jgi:hypothetical protein